MNTSRLASPADSSGTLYHRIATITRSVIERSLLSRISRRLAGVLCHGLLACIATASTVNVRWDPNPETDIANYRVNYGTSAGSRPVTVDAGLNTRASVTGLQEGTTYYFTVTAINTAGLESEPSDEISYLVPVTTVNPVTVIPRTGWTLQHADSQETNGYAAANAFDGNPATFWHTAFSSGTTPPPHEIGIDLGSVHPVSGFRYLPRQDALLTGNISRYEFHLSLDGTTWGSPVASGTFASSRSEKEVLFTVQNARYVRLRSLSEANGGNDCNVAELNILQGESVNPPVNQVPVAVSKSAVTSEDTPVAVALSASDADGQPLTYSIDSGPAKGSLSGTAPNLTYTPNADTNGADSFTYKANDGIADSNTATVSITVNAVNDAPVAVSKSATTSEDTPVSITLAASDKEGNPLTWSIVTPPAKGALSGTAPNLTYTPNADTNGADSFTYKANDGTANSNTATVSITVNAVNDAPVAVAKSAATSEDTPVSIVLAATDKEGNPLTWSIVSPPAKGALSGTAPNLTYTPNADTNGADSFTYKANDGTANSNTATVSITVNAVNDAPVAVSKSATTNEDTPVSITLAASDKEGSPLTWSIVSSPAKGALSGTAPNLTYTPNADTNGADSFTYKANDGTANSNTATVSITVNAGPDNADVIPQTGWTLKYVDSEDIISYAATNAFDGDPNTFWHTRWQSGATPPPHEIQINLGGIHALHGFRYLPRQGTSSVGTIAQYEFYTSLDGTTWGTPVAAGTFANSAEEKQVLFTAGNARYVRLRSLAEVNGAMHCSVAELNVLGTAAANKPPKADSKTVTTPEETPLAIKLGGSDPDGDALTWSITGSPSNGTLSGTTPNVTYTPAAGFKGNDSFTYQVNDGTVSSADATISIKVTPRGNPQVNRPPVFKTNPLALQSGVEGKSYAGASITDAASDPDKGDSITFARIAGPEWLGISAAGDLSGTPPAGSEGVNRFTVRATDTAGAYADSVLLIDIAAAELPLPWDLARIGKTTGKSRAAHRAGTFTLASSGNLAGKSDSGGFIWQTLTGDGEIIARVNGLDDAGKTSRVGLMIRDTLAANSRHVFMGVNGGGDFRWVRRTRTGGQTVMKSAGAGAVPKVWLRLVRKGETITASKSANGSNWTRVGSTKADFGKNCYIGISISSGDATPSTATFRSVTVNP